MLVLLLYLLSVAVAITFALWLGRSGGTGLPFLVLLALVLVGPIGLAFFLFWFLVHKPHRDALGPPPPP